MPVGELEVCGPRSYCGNAFICDFVGVPIITQSDLGIGNYGTANAQTSIRHRLDSNLSNTLQHRFASGHNNILSAINWSIFRRNFCPGFEDVLQDGVNKGWYDVNDILEKWVHTYIDSVYVENSTPSLLFRWIAIPWLQTEVDRWVSFKNKCSPRASRHKLLPHGIPILIRAHPPHFNDIDLKIDVPPVLFDEMEARYASSKTPCLRIGSSTVSWTCEQHLYCSWSTRGYHRDILERLSRSFETSPWGAYSLQKSSPTTTSSLNLIQCLFCRTSRLSGWDRSGH